MVNGYRQGMGVEQDGKGRIFYDGLYCDGSRVSNISRRTDDNKLWEERDSAGHILSICQKEENGLNHGKCVFFVNGELNVISSWVHGKEITTLQEFWGTTLLEYKHGKCVYKGPFE